MEGIHTERHVGEFIFVVPKPIVVQIDMYLLAEGSMRTMLVPMVTLLWSDVTYGSMSVLSDLSIAVHLQSFDNVQNLHLIELYSVSKPA